MPVKYTKSFTLRYFIISALVISADLFQNHTLEYFLKPLLMINLMLWYWINAPKPAGKLTIIVLVSLFFSCCGDVFLMIKPTSQILFISGLVSFLVAHLLYIRAYRLTSLPITQGIFRKSWWLLIPFVVFEIALLYLLSPNLKDLAIPVSVYATVLLLMAVYALNRYGVVPEISFRAVFIGALVFVVSDSLIAINKFYQPVPLARVWIMGTYCLSQWLIVWGLMKGDKW
ncbi:MAG: lysoplasmalogenase [Sphingobacteriales bacterium]|nr:MAG: lysoplasmalogenase [Sphingobacteriales bacterium]